MPENKDILANVHFKVPEGVTSIANAAYAGCRNIRSFTLPASLESIGPRAFYGCENLAVINLPEGLGSVDDSAFDGCSKLNIIFIDTKDEQQFLRVKRLLPQHLQDKIKANIESFRNTISTMGQARRDSNGLFAKLPEEIIKTIILENIAQKYGIPPFILAEIDHKLKHPGERLEADDRNNFTSTVV